MTDPALPSPDGQQYLADLQWAVGSPSLLTTSAITADSLAGECVDHGANDGWLTESRFTGFRVGKYFEHLIEQHIRRQPHWQMIACGQPIRDEGRTVGELDFVFRSGAEVYHIETAVKFYLYLPDRTCGGSQFVGPNSRDNFETKIARLFDHQLPLSQRWRPEVTIRQPHVKGIIFYPLDRAPTDRAKARQPAADLPAHLSPNHQRGTWFYASQLSDYLNSLADQRASVFHIHRKPHWLAPPVVWQGLTAADLPHTIDTHFQATPDRPLMISRGIISVSGKVFSERLFCMPDHWPKSFASA